MKRWVSGVPWSWVGGVRPLVGRLERRAVIRDALLWVALSLVAGQGDFGRWELAGGLLVMGVAVAVSRVSPLVSLFITAALTLWNLGFAAAMFVMSYLVGRRSDRAQPVVLAFAVLVMSGSVLLLVRAPKISVWIGMLVTLFFAGVVPWLVGRYRRQQQALVLAGWERAELLAREQRGIAEQARLRERARIAQDMHDSLGHELSLIALRAAAFEVASGLDERHRSAAGELRSAAATATERLREIVGVLRDDADPVPMEPARESIAELVDRTRASGLGVTLYREGEAEELPPMVDRAAYRVVQESLTNASKHAPGAAVRVRLVYRTAETVVAVANELPLTGPPSGRVSGHRGLLGLGERVRLVGGMFRAGVYDGRFEVVARFPHAADPLDAVATDRDAVTAAEPPSEAVQRLERVQRRMRRGLVAAVAVALAGLLTVTVGYYVYGIFNTVLVAADYQRLRIGQARTDLESVLPAREAPNRPPDPAGATCEYYTDGDISAQPRYRLCFEDGRLVTKDKLP
jgi:signal transduction histidine kinase